MKSLVNLLDGELPGGRSDELPERGVRAPGVRSQFHRSDVALWAPLELGHLDAGLSPRAAEGGTCEVSGADPYTYIIF